MTDLTETLRNAPILEGVGERVVIEFASAGRFRRLDKGEVLFRQTDLADSAYFVQSGSIAIYLATYDGRELVINEMYPVECFGELSLITNQPRSTGAAAREDSRVIAIPSDVFMAGLQEEPELLRRILEATAHRLRLSSERESAMAFLSAPARIARVLLLLDRQTARAGTVYITQDELAQYVGVARQTVAKTLSDWRDEGLVDTKRGRIDLINRDRLFKLSREGEWPSPRS